MGSLRPQLRRWHWIRQVVFGRAPEVGHPFTHVTGHVQCTVGTRSRRIVPHRHRIPDPAPIMVDQVCFEGIAPRIRATITSPRCLLPLDLPRKTSARPLTIGLCLSQANPHHRVIGSRRILKWDSIEWLIASPFGHALRVLVVRDLSSIYPERFHIGPLRWDFLRASRTVGEVTCRNKDHHRAVSGASPALTGRPTGRRRVVCRRYATFPAQVRGSHREQDHRSDHNQRCHALSAHQSKVTLAAGDARPANQTALCWHGPRVQGLYYSSPGLGAGQSSGADRTGPLISRH